MRSSLRLFKPCHAILFLQKLSDLTETNWRERFFLYQPKSFVVVGTLEEFISANGINEEKLGSFELFRKNLANPEIITFDELYERAKFIIQNTEQ